MSRRVAEQNPLHSQRASAQGALTKRARTSLLEKLRLPQWSSHPWVTKQIVDHVPFYAYTDEHVVSRDGAPIQIVRQREAGARRLSERLTSVSPDSVSFANELEHGLSEAEFMRAHRVPFPFRRYVERHFPLPAVAVESKGAQIKDLDGTWTYDLTGSFGLNVFGYEFYKDCLERGAELARGLGPVLGPLHPIVADNVRRLKAASGLDEVSFHMSGTEAVMQAVRLARYHTGRSHVVRFNGAYHGWWDGVMSAVASHREAKDLLTLHEMDDRSLDVLRKSENIACVLVNPLQALHPNRGAPGDSMLLDSSRSARFDRSAYARWLSRLREVCSERGVVLILDEVFLGFRLAYGGAQEYFGVKADMVTYGKTLGGGLPVGVVCGKHAWMRRFRDDRPLSVCFARGTFSSHPYVMGAMNEFLRRVELPTCRAAYAELDGVWNERAHGLNAQLEHEGLPVRVANLSSIWTVMYRRPSCYNWMLQYYLRGAGLTLGPSGTGRLILQHDLSGEDFSAISERFVAAVRQMQDDGWWYSSSSATNPWIRRRLLWEVLGKTLVARCSPRGRSRSRPLDK